MTRHLTILRIFWSASIAAEMEYRANFVIACITSLFTLAGAVLTIQLLYQNGYEMGGWSKPQAFIVLGVFTILEGLQAALMAPNRMRITQHVREGTLDFVLLKPVDTQFWLSFRSFSPWGLPNVLLGIAMLVYAGVELGLGPAAYLRGVVPIAFGAVILYCLGFALSTLTIWFVKLYNITMAMSAMLEAGRYPIAAYPVAYQVFFSAVLPVAFMTTVPAQTILGRHSLAWLAGLTGITLGLLLFTRWFWRFALRSYTSASS